MARIRLDHIGIAVNSLDDGEKFWKMLGLTSDEDDETNHEQGVNIRFLKTSDLSQPPQIELLSPTSSDTPVGKFIEKRGQGVQQLAFEVDDLQTMIDELLDSGIQMIDKTPKAGANGAKIAFVHPKSTGGVLVELLEK
ncbi:MAG: methylmalonyl-CoA epimerase [Euryarchaeota archaeon]|nr:methylmalonyl-CoA epimerase [Euryarchaeota archaeon]